MITTEDYVSFETAKLLKEKGFNGILPWVYIDTKKSDKKPILLDTLCNYNDGHIKDVISAPTLQLAMKWLREKYNLHCAVDYDFVLGWYCQITSLKETVEYDYEEMKHYHPDKDNGFSSPEEACETAIKYTLENLI